MAGDKKATELRPSGLIIITDPELGRDFMADTKQCVHCGCHWIVEPGSGKWRGWCGRCQGPCCSPKCTLECIPEEKWLDAMAKGIAPEQMPIVVHVPAHVPVETPHK